jgi:hypothetical protein
MSKDNVFGKYLNVYQSVRMYSNGTYMILQCIFKDINVFQMYYIFQKMVMYFEATTKYVFWGYYKICRRYINEYKCIFCELTWMWASESDNINLSIVILNQIKWTAWSLEFQTSNIVIIFHGLNVLKYCISTLIILVYTLSYILYFVLPLVARNMVEPKWILVVC